MISKEMQQYGKEKFNGISRIIFLASKERKEAFHKALPHFIQAQEDVYVGPNNAVWKAVIVPPISNLGAKNVLEAIVDSTIDEETYRYLILPSCEARCIRIEFFD